MFFKPTKPSSLQSLFYDSYEGLLSIPYFSRYGLNLLDNFFNSANHLELWIRLNPDDWLHGLSRPEVLSERLEFLAWRDVNIVVRANRNLHAKIFAALDKKCALIGSTNLSEQALKTNVEIWVELHDENYNLLIDEIETLKNQMPRISTDALFEIADITKSWPTINKKDGHYERLIEKVEKTISRILPSEKEILPLEEFIEEISQWDDNAAKVLVARYYNFDHNNLTGHVKHAYFGSMRFFELNPKWLQVIANLPSYPGQIKMPSQPWLDDWLRFLQTGEGQIYPDWDATYETLRIYVPSIYGGATEGGGAGMSTVKRMLKICALWLLQVGNL